MPDGSLRHLLRYGTHKEQSYFRDFEDCYGGIAINGNMLAHAPGAMAKFVGQVTTHKPFMVDPQTHAFQHNPRHLRRDSAPPKQTGIESLKVSISKMARFFGEPIIGHAGTEPVEPEHFDDQEVCRAFCQRVLDFQKQTLEVAAGDEDYKEYLIFAGIKALIPCLLIAPYFYMQASNFEKWFDLNLRLAEMSQQLEVEPPVYAQIVIDKNVLIHPDFIGRLADSYSGLHCPGICIWVDEFDEHDVDIQFLRGLIALIDGLAIHGKHTHVAYGGYFSALQTQFGTLGGFCHGLEYGEHRSVVPVGGGIPMAKYYFPPLHKRLNYTDVTRILVAKEWTTPEQFHANVCGCETCREVIGDNIENFRLFGETKPVTFTRKGQTVTLNYPLPETKDVCLQHYLRCKEREMQFIASRGVHDVAQQLRNAGDSYRRLLGDDTVAYTHVWADIIDPPSG